MPHHAPRPTWFISLSRNSSECTIPYNPESAVGSIRQHWSPNEQVNILRQARADRSDIGCHTDHVGEATWLWSSPACAFCIKNRSHSLWFVQAQQPKVPQSQSPKCRHQKTLEGMGCTSTSTCRYIVYSTGCIMVTWSVTYECHHTS